MKKTEKDEYTLKTPKFPLKAFMLYVLISDNMNKKIYYPLEPIYRSISELLADLKSFDQNNIYSVDLHLTNKAIIFPILLEELYPLEKRFWQKPILHYGHEDRVKIFSKVLDNHHFFKLIVTPLEVKKRVYYLSAIPLYNSATLKEIERFMLYSDFPVSINFKYAAIYSFDKPAFLNWQTGEITSIENRLFKENLH